MKKIIFCTAVCLILLPSCASLFNQVNPEELAPTPAELVVGYWGMYYSDSGEEAEGYLYFSESGYSFGVGPDDNGGYYFDGLEEVMWTWFENSSSIIFYQFGEDPSNTDEYYVGEFQNMDVLAMRFVGDDEYDEELYLKRVEDFIPGNMLIERNNDVNLEGKWFLSEEGFGAEDGGLIYFYADGKVGGSEEFFDGEKWLWRYDGIAKTLIWIENENDIYAEGEAFTVNVIAPDKIELHSDWDGLYLTKIMDPFTQEQEELAAELAKFKMEEWKEKRIAYNDFLNDNSKIPGEKPGQYLVKDVNPPEIEITSPSVKRGIAVQSRDPEIIIRGKATDESGIFSVVVNGVEAEVSENGEFEAVIRLAYGANNITVIAADPLGNNGMRQFEIDREANQMSSATTSLDQGFNELSGFGDYYALIIAVEDYLDKSVSDLDFPIDDAENVKNVLVQNYTFAERNVTFLKNPDRKEIIKAFQDLKNKLSAEDNLFIFYAGHGYWDESMRQGYWLPSNASKADPSEWLANSTVRDYIRGIRTRHTLMVADACFSGGIFKTREAFIDAEASIQKMYEMPSRKAITSGAMNAVPDKSVFVEYLIKRLAENRDKYLYSEKLFISFKDAVINNSPVNQTPLFGVINETGDEGGDFIFIKR